ncbi:MAG TPA: outer membrane beta-barrel protein [Gemmatimonadales bacterium]|nr:outer membrane beta-barrel protein [Gemmatimonadales bacterium]
MTIRVTGCLTAALVLAAPAAAQRGGTVEVGGFARYADFDNSLGMGTTVAVGGRAALYVGPALAVELDVARGSAGAVTHTPVHFRLVHNAPVGARIEALVGAGYVRNWYGAPYDASDGGLSVLLGLRYHATNRLWVRLGADLDAMFHTSDDSPFPFYNGNWGLQLGAGMRLKG